MSSNSLKNVESHFEFGANWLNYLQHVDEAAIEEAKRALTQLLPAEQIKGSRFFDIGCGSGVHSVAALRLGAREVVAVDIDSNSVRATSRLLDQFFPGAPHTVFERSIFDLLPAEVGQFDVVYSWGVLHHTGSMWEAVARASQFVAPQGLFALALYQKRITCGAWAREKRFYSRAGPIPRKLLRSLYKAALFSRMIIKGQNPVRFVRTYKAARGMNFQNDVHDWLGGYPYESASPAEVRHRLGEMGFSLVREKVLGPGLGVLGTGCAEYAFIRARE